MTSLIDLASNMISENLVYRHKSQGEPVFILQKQNSNFLS